MCTLKYGNEKMNHTYVWSAQFDGTLDTLYEIDSNINDVATIEVTWDDGRPNALSLNTANGKIRVRIGDYVLRARSGVIHAEHR